MILREAVNQTRSAKGQTPVNEHQKKAEKPRFDLIPAKAEKELAEAYTVGAKKYGAHNWRNLNEAIFVAALRRHLNALQRGEVRDGESNLTHAAHIAANALILAEKAIEGSEANAAQLDLPLSTIKATAREPLHDGQVVKAFGVDLTDAKTNAEKRLAAILVAEFAPIVDENNAIGILRSYAYDMSEARELLRSRKRAVIRVDELKCQEPEQGENGPK